MRHAMFFFEVSMSYVLAIDVGTSFTAAALVKPAPGSAKPAQGAMPVPEILPLGLHGSAVPSVLYYAEDGRVLVGEAAERRGLDDPHRMVREFKRRIGDSVPMAVGEQWLAPEEVFAGMARWVADRAEEREGSPASAMVLTHPAAWGGHRQAGVLAALTSAGLSDVTLISEPVAAALHYASQTRVEDGSTIAVYDLGGGTFDTAILRKAAAGKFELLGHPDGIETLGGADFDAAVLRHVAGHLGGAVEELDPAAPETLAALSRLHRECREAKEALSMDSEATIAVSLPGTQQSVRLVRSEFEALIESPVRDTVAALERSLERVALTPEDLTAVLLIGGSSRIPLVAELISAELERPIAVDADPKSSICLGAAVSMLPMTAGAAVRHGGVAADAGVVADAEAVAPAATQGEPGVPRPVVPRHTAALAALGTASAMTSRGSTRRGTGSGAHSGHRPGRHAPTSRIRLTAAAAAAATALTIATATAAQSPEGAGLMASMFGAQAADVIRDGGSPDSGQQTSGAVGGGTSPAPVSGKPASGLEASARSGTARAGNLRGQTPPRQGTSGAGAQGNGSGTTNLGTGAGTAVGGSSAGSGSTGTGSGAGGSTTGTTTPGTSTGTGSGTPGTSTPTSPPATEPGGAASGPTPDPSVPPVQDPTTPPVTDPSTPTTPSEPAPTTPSEPAPEPTTPLPEPTVIQDPAPAPSDTAPPPPSSESSPTPDPALTPAV
ncbi:Hsp70 family protein [Paenarthrobacter sp. NPDC089322]|uniref:Hsp70 family protein n=1 Tax=Paenarthrobacter sp. NPDC089322 TaxID=3155065 RepID=UPI0034180F5A